MTVGGRPATARFWPDMVSSNKLPGVPTWSVDWQPADGLYARVQVLTTTPDVAVAAAEAMLLDRSQFCVAPLRLDPAPAGYTVVGCSIDFGHIFPGRCPTSSSRVRTGCGSTSESVGTR